jgi:ubiquinone/menaquinone biosynthesis C-methylase UbiE
VTVLKTTWSTFTPEVAKIYLDGHGSPSARSKELMASVLKELFGPREFRLADFGCGNGHLFGFFRSRGLDCEYLGCDFSTTLISAGCERYPGEAKVRFLEVDIEDPELTIEKCDIVLYSHVLEMLQSPQKSLLAARRTAPMAMIRFFEPPIGDYDIAAVHQLDTGGPTTGPYLRRTISKAYYNLLLQEAGCRAVDVHQVEGDKDQVHVLHFEK